MSENREKKWPGEPARQWWRGLQPAPENGRSGDRAALARLRRADPASAMMEEPTLTLFQRLGLRDRTRLARVATLTSVLAHVRKDTDKPFGAAVGRETINDKDSAVMSLLRFQRLLDSESEEEIGRGFRRAVALLGSEANVADLARIILFYEDERTRQGLAFAYFAAGAAAPPGTESEPAANI